MDKKGAAGDWIMFIVYLIAMLIVAGAIGGGTYWFFGSYDGRQAEANTLFTVIEKCMENKAVDWTNADNFYAACRLNKNELNSGGYIINICNEECKGNLPGVFSVGSNFEACRLTAVSNDYPKCKIGLVSSSDGKLYEVIAGSNRQFRSGA